jgi:hypothetical protein
MKIQAPVMLLAAGLALFQTSCQTQQKLEKNQAAAQAWLGEQHAAAHIRVAGNWFAEGWGKASFKQSGREVTGTLDTYEIKGVVSGNKAYLTAWESGKCYYALILSQTSANALSGSYTDGPVFNHQAKAQRLIELRRSY